MGVFHSRQDLLVRTSDGRNVALQEPLEYISDTGSHYRAPIGTTSDGASTPPELWPKIPPFGSYWLPAVLHDAAYRGTLEVWTDTGWKLAMLTKDQSDALLLEAMTTLRVEDGIKKLIYEGVHLFGQKAFRDDRVVTA